MLLEMVRSEAVVRIGVFLGTSVGVSHKPETASLRVPTQLDILAGRTGRLRVEQYHRMVAQIT